MTIEIVTRICSVEGCLKVIVRGGNIARLLCTTHYNRFKRHGDPLYRDDLIIIRPQGNTLEERFWSKVNKDGDIQPNMDTPCWIWLGSPSNRYGRFEWQKIRYDVHRLSYEMAYGDIPDGLFVCHHCDVPKCVRPDHLFAGTALENMQDKYAKGRGMTSENHWMLTKPERIARGEGAGNVTLTENDVRAIRQKFVDGVNTIQLAGQYKVSRHQIYQIIRRKQWKHIE